MGRQEASPRKKKKLTLTYSISPIWGDETPGLMAMTIGTLGDLVDLINRSDFGFDRFTGFHSVKGRKRSFHILKWDCP